MAKRPLATISVNDIISKWFNPYNPPTNIKIGRNGMFKSEENASSIKFKKLAIRDIINNANNHVKTWLIG